MSGTEWTERCEKRVTATVGELENALFDERYFHDLPATYDSRQDAYRKIKVNPSDSRTNLRLTGQPLTSEDIQRIATCEVK